MTPKRSVARFLAPAVFLTILANFIWALPILAQDVITVGTVSASGTSVDVPVYIRDVSGTPLGIDKPAGSRIESFSIQVVYAPSAAVSSVTFTRAGITAPLSPTFETSPTSSGAISLIATFTEAGNLIPFNLNGAAPGDLVAHLVFTLSASATPGSSISLTLDSGLTQLTDQGGDASTKEFSGSNLTLVNGAINIPFPSITLTPTSTGVDLNGVVTGTVNLSTAVAGSTAVGLSSSNTSVATVPSSVTIPSGQVSATFSIAGVAIGSATITGTLPPALGGGNSTMSVAVTGPALTLTPPSPHFSVSSSGSLSARISTAQPSPTTVSLSSSDSTVVTVPATVVITAGLLEASFTVSPLKVGTATVQGNLSPALGGSVSSLSVQVDSGCVTPAAPSISAPAAANSGSPYDIVWAAVSGATAYDIDEATSADFSGASTRTVTTNKATYAHTGSADVRYYYRVRAKNGASGCGQTSPLSNSVSVVVTGAAMGVLPVAGSLAGGFGSFFKTSVQLYNPTDAAISGKIIYHPAGTSGSASDPSLAYSLQARKSIAYDDLLPAMGLSGIGSVDVVPNSGPLPMAAVRVFNDAGAAGTSGLSESILLPADVLQQGDTGVLIAPADLTKFRLNIGVRTLDLGATLSITVRDRDGNTTKTLTKSYGPTLFSQVTSADLLDHFVLNGSESISFAINSGSAIIYGSTTDNTTNDPTFQLAAREP